MPLKEEKHGLKKDRTRISPLILLFFFASRITAQTETINYLPINGFCRFNEFAAKQSQSLIHAIDLNADGWRDFISFDGKSNKYFVQFRDNTKSSTPSERYFHVPFYDLHSLSSDERGKRFVYASRGGRQIGIVNFSRSGSAALQSKIILDSYPSAIDAADIDRDGRKEILVSGSSFNGISIVKESAKGLREFQKVSNEIFSQAYFVDLDYDLYPDIAAVNLFKNSVVLFSNNADGSFNETRTFGSESEIIDFKTEDLNSDGFTDLVTSHCSGFQVFAGDSVSAFDQKFFISTPVKPDKFTVLDFNADGYNDIAFISIKTGSLYLIFAQSTNVFYPPQLYLKREGISDLNSFVDRSGRVLSVLDSNGKIYVIDKVPSSDDNFSLALGGKPGIIGSFDLYNDKSEDIFFIDEEKQKLVLLVGEKDKLLKNYFSVPLIQNYDNVVVDEMQSARKTFFCYSSSSRVIELLRVNFIDKKFSRKILYAEGPIIELKITSDRLKDRQTIFVLINKNGRLFMQSFDFKDFRYINSGTVEVTSSFQSAALLFDVYKEIFHFSFYKNNLSLVQSTFNMKITGAKKIADIPALSQSYDVAGFESNDIHNNIAFAWFKKNESTNFILAGGKRTKNFEVKNFVPSKKFVKHVDDYNGSSIFMYDKQSGLMKALRVKNNLRNLGIEDVFESKEINSYIAAVFNGKKEYLVYSKTSNNFINISRVK